MNEPLKMLLECGVSPDLIRPTPFGSRLSPPYHAVISLRCSRLLVSPIPAHVLCLNILPSEAAWSYVISIAHKSYWLAPTAPNALLLACRLTRRGRARSIG